MLRPPLQLTALKVVTPGITCCRSLPFGDSISLADVNVAGTFIPHLWTIGTQHQIGTAGTDAPIKKCSVGAVGSGV